MKHLFQIAQGEVSLFVERAHGVSCSLFVASVSARLDAECGLAMCCGVGWCTSNDAHRFSLVRVCLSCAFRDVCGHIPHCASLVKPVGTSYVFLVFVSRMPVVRASMCARNAGSIRQATIVILCSVAASLRRRHATSVEDWQVL